MTEAFAGTAQASAQHNNPRQPFIPKICTSYTCREERDILRSSKAALHLYIESEFLDHAVQVGLRLSLLRLQLLALYRRTPPEEWPAPIRR